jgi:UDP-N-acetylmuramate: L-alanyl-gamma-D-glutamyl-meso-diaminopimelate ligase
VFAEKEGFFAEDGEGSSFNVFRAGQLLGAVDWGLTGQHNQDNALAVIAAAEHVGVAPLLACKALSAFQGVKRRMELRGVAGNVRVFDDFAHHPTAIDTTIAGLRKSVREGRILAVFEPRSNTMKLGAMRAQLPHALRQADVVFCYTKGLEWDAQEALSGLTQPVFCTTELDALVAAVVLAAQPQDCVLVMSNGGFAGVHDKLLEALAVKFAQCSA